MIHARLVETERDRQDALAIRRRVFVEEQGVPAHLEVDAHEEHSIHFIAYDDDEPVGAGRLRPLEGGIGKAERICILPSHRGRHIGVLMMQMLEDRARQSGIRQIQLHAQTHAIPFYEKLGYRTTSPEFLDAGAPHRAMEKDL